MVVACAFAGKECYAGTIKGNKFKKMVEPDEQLDD